MRSIAVLAAFAATFAIALPARSQDPLPRAAPAAVGMSAERLARIRPAFQAEVDAGRMPGAVIAIARRGQLVLHEAVGFIAPSGAAMPQHAIFAIASMTKPWAGVAIMQLLEQGKLALQDPVERFLPMLGNRQVAEHDAAMLGGHGPVRTVPARRSITIEDLLRHTSGITYGGRGTTAVHRQYPASSNAAGAELTADAFLARLAAAPLLFQPGTVWDYSLSMDVLGLIVEKVSGQPLDVYLRENLFGPLGMASTFFQVPPAQAARIARPLANDPATGRPQSVPDRARADRFACGGGCGASTAGDYLRFGQMLLNGGSLGGTRILGRATVDAMRADHLAPGIDNRITGTDPLAEGYGFGLTMAVRQRASGLIGSPGDFYWNGAYGTLWWADPREEMVVVFMTQAPGIDRRRFRQMMNALAYQAIIE